MLKKTLPRVRERPKTSWAIVLLSGVTAAESGCESGCNGTQAQPRRALPVSYRKALPPHGIRRRKLLPHDWTGLPQHDREGQSLTCILRVRREWRYSNYLGIPICGICVFCSPVSC